MRRWLCFTVFLGALIALLSAVPASAEECDGDLPARVNCWTKGLDGRGITVIVDQELPFRGTLGVGMADQLRNLEVRVPEVKATGQGGTALLVLAGHRYIHPKARITRLTTAQVGQLETAGACTPRLGDLCDELGGGNGAVSGTTLVGKYGIAALPKSEHSLAGDEGSDLGSKDWLLIGMCALLAVLLAALLLAVRRTHRPLAVATGAPARGIQEPERTTRLRVVPHGRAATPRPGPSRAAVVRTDLHPQGYVELDRVLYRAVWAEPGQVPPPPGSRVDVADAPEADSDALYAFPPAAGRHAHAR